MNQDQIQRAETFRKLHHSGKILVLLNIWDAASARIFEMAGAPAVATTSSGLAAANGYPDGQHIPVDQLVSAVRRITRVVKIPVSVDLEKGFGRDGAQVRETVRLIAEAGAIGMNIEDGTEPSALLVEKIKAIRAYAHESGVPLFINARTDVFLRGIGEPDTRFDETIRRIESYAAAGADNAFVPGVIDPNVIGRIAKASKLPLNVMFSPGLPPIADLQALGVARLSIGGAGTWAALSLARKIAQEMLTQGTYDTLMANRTVTHVEVMKMFPAD
jgi:2-methylisocitrate lyase-like PEP mutase family enzyme